MLVSFKNYKRTATIDDLVRIASGELFEDVQHVELDDIDKSVINEIRRELLEADTTPHDVPEDENEDIPADDPYKNAVHKTKPYVNPNAKPTQQAPVTGKPVPTIKTITPAQQVAKPTAQAPVTIPSASAVKTVVSPSTKQVPVQAGKNLPKVNVVGKPQEPVIKNQVDTDINALKKRLSKSSQKWKDFTANVKNLLGNMIRTISPSYMSPGYCYFFKYKSKMYDEMTIDFYEQNPLIICLEIKPKVILGLNMHYLSPAERKDILRRLNVTPTKGKLKINLTWDLAKQILGVKAKRMIKAYLPNRIKECYTVLPHKLHIFTDIDFSNFTADVNRTYVWRDHNNLKNNKFNLNPIPKP